MRALALAGLMGALALSQGAAHAACLKNGQAITGTLKWISLTEPNGKPIPSPFLILAKPACAHDSFGDAKGTRVQLLLSGVDPLKDYREGDTITATGDYGPPETRWHIGDIIAFNAKIVGGH